MQNNNNSKKDRPNVIKVNTTTTTNQEQESAQPKIVLANLFKAPVDPDELEAERDWLYGRSSVRPTLKTTPSSTFKK